MASSKGLFESLYESMSSEIVEECAAGALSSRRLHRIAQTVFGTEEEEATKRRESPGHSGDPHDLESLYRQNENIQEEGISIVQRKRAKVLGTIWKYYDDGNKGFLLIEDMIHVVHDYLQVVLRKAPSRIVDQVIEGAKVGILIARKRNSYVRSIDADTIAEYADTIEQYINLLRSDIERGVSDMIRRLLRPTTLRRISREVFEKCDASTNDGWLSELEFKNGFLDAVHSAIEWNEIAASTRKLFALNQGDGNSAPPVGNN